MKVGTALNMLCQDGRSDASVVGEHLAMGDLAEPGDAFDPGELDPLDVPDDRCSHGTDTMPRRRPVRRAMLSVR